MTHLPAMEGDIPSRRVLSGLGGRGSNKGFDEGTKSPLVRPPVPPQWGGVPVIAKRVRNRYKYMSSVLLSGLGRGAEGGEQPVRPPPGEALQW